MQLAELFAKDVSASFLMPFVACSRPFPVTQHPGNPLPLSGQPCTAQSPCCGSAGRHDSHYVCVKFKGGYFPCPAREQPDYDEIVAFNVAAFKFKRRRRTLLWLDDHPQKNFSMLRTFPGPRVPTAVIGAAGAGVPHAAALHCLQPRSQHGPQSQRNCQAVRESI